MPVILCPSYLHLISNLISLFPLIPYHGGSSVLASAGIDTSVFKAHSICGAATSHVFSKGVPTAEILHAADWTSERTFRKYYLRQCNPQG